MEHAINCLERELATLANNFAVQADADAKGKDRDDEQQNLRWQQMEGLRRGIASLRHANTGQAQFNRGVRNQYVDQFAHGQGAFATGKMG
jgi:hypothetical protein